MNIQQVFDRAVQHMLTQNRQSTLYVSSRTICAYRGSEGAKCVIGALIDDEHYRLNLEDTGYLNPLVPEALRLSGVDVDEDATGALLGALQNLHDGFPTEDWGTGLHGIAARYGLEFNYVPA